jgi:hypothetical protein
MATYDIAPANTGSEIGMAQMIYGLENKANYNAANLSATDHQDLQTLASTPTTYQGDLTSKTWDGNSPYGFAEMAGQTWNDGPTIYTYTLFASNGGDNCDKAAVSISVNGTPVASMSSAAGSSPSWNVSNFQANSGDTIQITAQSQGGGGAGCINFDTDIIVFVGGTSVLGPINSLNGQQSHSFTASSSTNISVTTTATY